jgi:hypothetical protein
MSLLLQKIFSIMTFNITTISIMTISIATLSIRIEYPYGDSHVFLIVMLNVIMPSVIMLSVIVLSVVAPYIYELVAIPNNNILSPRQQAPYIAMPLGQ